MKYFVIKKFGFVTTINYPFELYCSNGILNIKFMNLNDVEYTIWRDTNNEILEVTRKLLLKSMLCFMDTREKTALEASFYYIDEIVKRIHEDDYTRNFFREKDWII